MAGSKDSPVQGKVTLSQAVAAVREELVRAHLAADPQMPIEVGEIEINFEVEIGYDAKSKLGVSIFPVTAGVEAGRSRKSTHRLTVKLYPKDAKTGGPQQVSSGHDKDPFG